jgi:hypothetical protein
MGVRERKREKVRKQKVQQQKISKAGNQKATPAQGAASPHAARRFRFSNNALLLGEGDFSFSAACVRLQGGRLLRDQSLVVSAYDSKVQ